MLSIEARPTRRNVRDRRPSGPAAVEALESRQLLAFSPVGFSLPDLTVDGYSAPVAAWGGPFSVTVNVHNIGASSMIEPLALFQGAPSSADSGPVTVQVFLTSANRPVQPALQIGQINIDNVPQNSSLHENATFILPLQPRGFPGFGGQMFVSFRVQTRPVTGPPEIDPTNNVFVVPQTITIEPPLPQLAAIGLDVPPVMQPGDTIQPNIEVGNFGTVDSGLQGPFEVDLVATNNTALRGARVIARYQVEDLHGLSEVPQTQNVLGDVNIDKPFNVEILRGAPVTLPTFPRNYFLTVVVDPGHKILQISDLSRTTRQSGFNALNQLRPFRHVGPPIPFLPPAGVLQSPSSPFTNPFPDTPFPVNGATAALTLGSTGLSAAAAANLLAAGAATASAQSFSPQHPGGPAGLLTNANPRLNFNVGLSSPAANLVAVNATSTLPRGTPGHPLIGRQGLGS